MTKAEIKKMIAEFEAKIEAEKGTELVLEEIYTNNNGREYAIPTGEYKLVKKVIAGPNEKEYEKHIAELAHELYRMDEDKRRREKAKRYQKELAELEERKAYLEKWLAENA